MTEAEKNQAVTLGVLLTVIGLLLGVIGASFLYTFAVTDNVATRDDVRELKMDLIREMDRMDYYLRSIGISEEGPPYRPEVDDGR